MNCFAYPKSHWKTFWNASSHSFDVLIWKGNGMSCIITCRKFISCVDCPQSGRPTEEQANPDAPIFQTLFRPETNIRQAFVCTAFTLKEMINDLPHTQKICRVVCVFTYCSYTLWSQTKFDKYVLNWKSNSCKGNNYYFYFKNANVFFLAIFFYPNI